MKTGLQIQFGKALRKARKKRKLTQEQLAEKADLHPTYISDIERGARNVSLENIVGICTALGMKTYELFKLASI